MSSRRWRSTVDDRLAHGKGDAELVFANGGDGPLRVPGVSLPISIERCPAERFAHGFDDWAQPRLTARELAMMSLMNEITDRSDWSKAVHDAGKIAGWRQHALQRPLISTAAWDWCLLELQDMAKMFSVKGFVRVFNAASRICKSDGLLSAGKLASFAAVTSLLAAKHARSPFASFDVVDPFLFPLTYGRSRVLDRGGKVSVRDAVDAIGRGQVIPRQTIPPSTSPQTQQSFGLLPSKRYSWDARVERFSTRFQWLPSEVEFVPGRARTGKTTVRIASYINNLHPRETAAYQMVEEIITDSIKMWNNVLVYRDRDREPARIKTHGANWWPPLPDWFHGLQKLSRDKESTEYKETSKKLESYFANIPPTPSSVTWMERGPPVEAALYPDMTGVPLHDLHSDFESRYRKIRTWLHPEPGVSFSFHDWKSGRASVPIIPEPVIRGLLYSQEAPDPAAVHDFYSVSLERDFKESGLQVYVHLFTVELSPDDPVRPATEWQIHGSGNEHIVATTLLYLESSNMTANSGSISFRAEADLIQDEYHYEQGNFDALGGVFGFDDPFLLYSETEENYALQELGTVLAPDGRLVVYPNVLHHRLDAYELLDKTRGGFRRGIMIHLADPHYRVCSTRNVPPQRYDWKPADGRDCTNWLQSRLPAEIKESITNHVSAEDWPIQAEEAAVLWNEAVNVHADKMEDLLDRVYPYQFHG